MGWDEHGNWIFTPHLDPEDKELLEDELKRRKVREAVETQEKVFEDQGKVGQIFTKKLKGRNLDHSAFQQLKEKNPEKFFQAMEKASEILVDEMLSVGPPAKESGRQRKQEPTPDISELRERARKGTLDEMDVIDALFPDPLWK